VRVGVNNSWHGNEAISINLLSAGVGDTTNCDDPAVVNSDVGSATRKTRTVNDDRTTHDAIQQCPPPFKCEDDGANPPYKGPSISIKYNFYCRICLRNAIHRRNIVSRRERQGAHPKQGCRSVAKTPT
jgi:hypothetical protein